MLSNEDYQKAQKAHEEAVTNSKSKPDSLKCAVCGRSVRSKAYVGYEDQALCHEHRESYATTE